MANPYHDSAGKFCSKGEMLADIKKLAESGDFSAYATLRKEFDDIQHANGLSEHEIIEDDLDNRIKLKLNNEADAQQSYDLVKDKIGGTLDNLYVDRLLGSRFLTEEQRAEIIENASEFALHRALEGDAHRHPTTQALSVTDYNNIMNREDSDSSMPFIAKNQTLGFEERKNLLENSPWGVALLGIHNPEKFYKDETLVAKLRKDVEENGNSSHGLSALASSPYDEDHERIIGSNQAHEGYPSASVQLAGNRSLSLNNAKALLSKEAARETSVASSVAYKLGRNLHGDDYKAEQAFNETKVRNQHKYHNAAITESRKKEILAEIDDLAPETEKSFVSEAANRTDYLVGQLYANDSDYKALRKEYAAARKMPIFKGQTPEAKRKGNILEWRLKRAENVREVDRVLKFIDSKIS